MRLVEEDGLLRVESGLLDGVAGAAISQLPQVQFVVTCASFFAVAVGCWWLLLAPLSWRYQRLLRAVVLPLANQYEKRHALALFLLDLVLALGGGAYLITS